MHESTAVAKKLLDLARAKGDALTPMQLIKLVYICHGWMLGLHSRPLLRENVEAWTYGPVIRSLYNQVKKYRNSPVTDIPGREEKFDDEENRLIDQVYNQYGSLDGIRLSQMTHMPSSPWHETWSYGGKNSVISNDLIENFYSKKAESASR